MIRIRLQRKGRKKRPIYHLVVADSRSARDGRIIELVGRYDNVTEKKEVVLKEDRILYWLDNGAQPSDTVRKILRNEGVLYKRHLTMWGKNEEEIEAALEEWRSYRDSKGDDEISRKDAHKDVLAAEEKEFKSQVEQKAAKAAAELETEAAAEDTEEATSEAAPEESTETEETANEAPAETTEEEEAAPEETTEVVEEEKAEEPVAEEAVEEKVEESPAEEEVEETKVEASAEGNSNDMTAKDAIDHIKNSDLAALEGFIADDESRKTVLSAWEEKKSEG